MVFNISCANLVIFAPSFLSLVKIYVPLSPQRFAVGRLLLCVLLPTLLAYTLGAQAYLRVGKYYSVEDGLPERILWDVKKDSLGYLWLGTNHGLCRFDGMRFLNLTQGLPVAPVKRVEVLSNRQLLLAFGPEVKRFALFDVHTFLPHYYDLPAGTVDLAKDSKGRVFVLAFTEEGFGVFVPGQAPKMTLLYRLKLPKNRHATWESARLLALRDGRHLLYDGAGTFLLTDGRHALMQTLKAPVSKATTFFYEDLQGLVWTAFQEFPGVYNVDLQAGEVRSTPAVPGDLFYLGVWGDRMGNLIFAEKDARSNYVRSLKALRAGAARTEDLDRVVATESRITSIMADNFFDYLFLTSYIGLHKLQLAAPSIQQTAMLTNIKKGEFGNIIRAIAKGGDGKVYFSKEAGDWFVYDSNTQTTKVLLLKDHKTGKIWHPALCMGMYTDARGTVWGYHAYEDERLYGTLLAYDPFLQQTRSFPCPIQGIIYFIYPDADGQGFWIAFKQPERKMAVGYFKFADQSFSQQNLRWKPASFWKGLLPNSMLLLGPDTLLLATNKGVLNIHLKQNTVESWLGQTQHGVLSEGVPVMAMARLNHAQWLLGTEGRGLVVYNQHTQKVDTVYEVGNGLPNNDVCSILGDKKGNFWLGTFRGLSCFNPSDKSFQSFFTADGLPDNEMNRRAQFKDGRGRLYFGTMNGLAFFDPEQVLQNRRPNAAGKIVLTALSYFDRQTNAIVRTTSGIDTLQKIILPAGERFLSLSIALTDHQTPEQHRFEYRVAGWPAHAAWATMENYRLHFDYLPSGNYTLYLRARNHYGALCKEEKAIRLIVRDYFYAQPWFIACCMAMLGLGMYGLYRLRVAQLLRIERLRTVISSDLHDEVGGMLSGVAMQADLLEDRVEEHLRPTVRRIGYTCRNVATSLRDVVWAIDARQDNAAGLLLRMQDFAARTLALAHIETQWHTHSFTDRDFLTGQKRHHLYLIYKELATNCMRHSNATKVTIELEKQRNALCLRFKDNGQGFDLGQPNTGMGLSNIRMRAEKIGAALRFWNDEGFGAELRVPI